MIACRVLVGKPATDYLEDLEVDGKIVLKFISEKGDGV